MNENHKIAVAIGTTVVVMLVLWWLTKSIGILPLGLLALLVYVIWRKMSR